MTLLDWRPTELLVVAQLDVTVEQLQEHGLAVELDDVHGEHATVLRIPTGRLFCLVATPPYAFGFCIVSDEADGTTWQEALEPFLAHTPFARSAVIWVPGDKA